jgi:CSLREA domain-containing protein
MPTPFAQRPTGRSVAALLVVWALALGAALAGAPPAHAGGTIDVTTTDDELNADGDCSLREAIVASNTNAPVDTCPAGGPGVDAINLQPQTYVLSIPGRDEDAAVTGDLDITEGAALRTDDPGGAWATIDGAGIDRVFDVMPGARWGFTFMDITGGDAAGDDGGGVRVGDGICVDGNPSAVLGLESVTLRDNVAARGGGIHIGSCWHAEPRWLSIVRNAASAEGGGLSITGNSHLTLRVSTVSGNTAAVGGGLWIDLPDGAIHLAHVTVAENDAPAAAGLWTANWTTLDSTIVAENAGENCGGPGVPTSGLSDDNSCLGQVVDDVGLRALTQIGRHFVHPLDTNSVAVDLAGEPFPVWCEAESSQDQVGTAWPIDGNQDGVAECDFGAVEAPEGTAHPPSTPTPGPSPSGPALPDTALPQSSTPPAAWAIVLGAMAMGASAALGATIRWRPRRKG